MDNVMTEGASLALDAQLRLSTDFAVKYWHLVWSAEAATYVVHLVHTKVSTACGEVPEPDDFGFKLRNAWADDERYPPDGSFPTTLFCAQCVIVWEDRDDTWPSPF